MSGHYVTSLHRDKAHGIVHVWICGSECNIYVLSTASCTFVKNRFNCQTNTSVKRNINSAVNSNNVPASQNGIYFLFKLKLYILSPLIVHEHLTRLQSCITHAEQTCHRHKLGPFNKVNAGVVTILQQRENFRWNHCIGNLLHPLPPP